MSPRGRRYRLEWLKWEARASLNRARRHRELELHYRSKPAPSPDDEGMRLAHRKLRLDHILQALEHRRARRAL